MNLIPKTGSRLLLSSDADFFKGTLRDFWEVRPDTWASNDKIDDIENIWQLVSMVR